MIAPMYQFYSFSNNGKLEKHEDLESSFITKTRFVLYLEKTIVSNGPFGNTHLECFLYDGITKDLLTTFSKWRISEIETKMDGYHKTTLLLSIKDSNGVMKTIEFVNFHINQERLFKLLFALEAFDKWEDYEMQLKQDQILDIERQIKDLKKNLKVELFELEEKFEKNKQILNEEKRRLEFEIKELKLDDDI